MLELDLSINKSFFFKGHRLLLRADLFNFINRANFGVPIHLLEVPGFGRATGMIMPGQCVPFLLKYSSKKSFETFEVIPDELVNLIK